MSKKKKRKMKSERNVSVNLEKSDYYDTIKIQITNGLFCCGCIL